jgi:hypothetical protein
MEKCLPKWIYLVNKVGTSNIQTSQLFISVISKICNVFGKQFTTIATKKHFQIDLEKVAKEGKFMNWARLIRVQRERRGANCYQYFWVFWHLLREMNSTLALKT